MKRFKWVLFGMALMLICSVLGTAQSGSEALSKAQALLTQGRTVLGGEEKLKEIKGISIEGKIRRVADPETATNPLALKMIMLTDDRPMFHIETGGGVAGTTSANEEHDIVIMRSEKSKDGELPPPGKSRRVMILKEIDKDGGPGQEGLPNRHMMLLPPDMTNWMQALFLQPRPNSVASYIGSSPDGQLDLIEFQYPDFPGGFSSRVGLDKSTHLPVTISYKDLHPVTMIFEAEKDEKGTPGENRTFQRRIRVHSDDAQATTVDKDADNIELRFSDHRYVDGVMLPHHVTKVVNGQIQEEWDIEKFELNPKMEMPERKMRKIKK